MIRSFVDAILYPFRMLSRIPSNIISSPRRMLGLSLPARASLLLFLALLLAAIVWAVLNYLRLDIEQYQNFFWRELPTIAVLVVVIPLVVWYALKLWLEGEASPYPDIDRAWKAALEAMAEQSIDPTETPIFLILGPGNEAAVQSFMSASNLAFPVRAPAGPAPLHVYANQQSVYIVCTETCQLGRFLSGATAAAAATSGPAPTESGFDPTRTMQVGGPGQFTASQPPAPAGNDPAAARADMPSGLADVRVPVPAQNQGGDIRGTMLVGDAGGAIPSAGQAPLAPAAAKLNPHESSESTARLTYLCRLLRRVRDPLCPANGVLVTTPFAVLADGSQEAVNQLLMSLKSDLATLRGTLRIRCSINHIIDGMENEAGFRELIRRVGGQRASSQRFGKGFGLWNLPTADQLDALVKHACGAFEDWSYLLFREGEGLSKPGNRHLYALLCRIRSSFQPRLGNVIRAAYATDPTATDPRSREPLLFSGCYFVADGATPDRQAFLASVFKKSSAEEEELEWGSEALSEERRMQGGVQVLLILNGVFVAAIVALLLYHFQFKS